ncbi:helix-turn-helix domain-containing protein [Nonomuraea lactucae]|uniref:helix-turn-helix domain-containing protein n=1 Tax=Nonomuraea lactucae TaxID=2249762 RepID=UPI000DE3C0D2|nr:helix-turn-helix domain-containing protein [Nonomuraea lactucae]
MALRSRELLRELMKGRHDTVTLAKQVGLTKQAIQHLTSGRRTSCSRGTAELLAEALGVEVGTLFSHPASENSNTKEQKVLLTIPEAAKAMRVSRSHAYRLVADGDLPIIDVGRKSSKKPMSRVPVEAIQAWIAKRAAAQS